MKHAILRTGLSVIVALTLSAFLTLAANAASMPKNPTIHTQAGPIQSTAACIHLQVYLHGTAPATIKCLDQHTNVRKTVYGVVPYGISAVSCDTGSLILYEDSNFSGATLCLKGSGSTDLVSYCLPWYRGGCAWHWDNRVSSMIAGCSPGSIYYNTGEVNLMFTFIVDQRVPTFDGKLNDAAESVRLDKNC